MAQTFNPEILEKIFIALTYFRTWVLLFLFPFVVLIPDFAFNYCLSIYFPSPMDIVIYNEQVFKLNKKEVNITPVPDIVVFPSNEEGINLKPTKKNSDENLSIDKNIEAKEIKLSHEKKNSEKLAFRTEGKIREPESDRNLINSSKPQLSKKNKDNQQYNSVDFNQPEEPIEQIKEKVSRKEMSKDKKSKKKESKSKKFDKRDSNFEDVDFEMMEGKFILNFVI